MVSISFSKLSSFLTCQLKYNYSYVKQLEVEKTVSSSAQLGKYIHKVLEEYREGLDINELAQVHRPNYIIAEQENKVIPSMLDTALEFYKPYAGLLYESEQNLNYVIKDQHGDREDIKLVGIIDKLYFHPDGKVSVIDFKTGKVKSDNSLQMKFYVYLLNKLKGIDPKNAECKIFYLRLKQSVPYQFDEQDINEFENFITSMMEVMQNTTVFKHSFGYWCSFCDFRNACAPFQAKKELHAGYSSHPFKKS